MRNHRMLGAATAVIQVQGDLQTRQDKYRRSVVSIGCPFGHTQYVRRRRWTLLKLGCQRGDTSRNQIARDPTAVTEWWRNKGGQNDHLRRPMDGESDAVQNVQGRFMFRWRYYLTRKSHCHADESARSSYHIGPRGPSGHDSNETASPVQSMVAEIGPKCRKLCEEVLWMHFGSSAIGTRAHEAHALAIETMATFGNIFLGTIAIGSQFFSDRWLLQSVCRSRSDE